MSSKRRSRRSQWLKFSRYSSLKLKQFNRLIIQFRNTTSFNIKSQKSFSNQTKFNICPFLNNRFRKRSIQILPWQSRPFNPKTKRITSLKDQISRIHTSSKSKCIQMTPNKISKVTRKRNRTDSTRRWNCLTSSMMTKRSSLLMKMKQQMSRSLILIIRVIKVLKRVKKMIKTSILWTP